MKEREFKELKLTKNVIIPFPNFQQNTIISPTQMNDNFEEIEYAYNNLIDNHNGAITKINKVLKDITSTDNDALTNEEVRVQNEKARVESETLRIENEEQRISEEKKRIAMYNTHMNDETKRQQTHREMVSAFNSKVSEVDNAIASIPSKEELKGEKGDKGDRGEQGVSIRSITEYYQVNTSNTVAPSSWLTVAPVLTPTNKYLWNYRRIDYTDGSATASDMRVIGVYGDKGEKGEPGVFDSTTLFNSLNTSNKTVIGAINELFALIQNNNNGGGTETPNIPVTDIICDEWDVKLSVGQSKQMVADVVPSNATNKKINWSSSNTYVADVTDKGLIIAKSEGYSKVSAITEDGGFTYDIHVNVSGNSLSGIVLNPSQLNLKVGESSNIGVALGSDVSNTSLDFMSSNKLIATVSKSNDTTYTVSGVGEGQTTIRFRTQDGAFDAWCTVTVEGSSNGSNSYGEEYEMSCTPEYILDKMYPMGQSHEAIPSGLITDTWKHNTRWENQYRPTAVSHGCGVSNCPGTGKFQALGCWSNIYRVEGTSFTQNTGVEMKDIKVYGWYNGAWELVQHLPVPNGNFYAESFGGDASKHFSDSVKQTSTSKTVILREANKIQAMNWNTGQLQTENCMYHPFSDVKNFDTKYEYIYTCIDMRKVKWDESGIDDRDNTHYCSNCGGDWWLAEGLMFHDSWQHNKGVCQPKMIEITNEWRRFSMTTVPQGWSNGFPK